MLRASRFDLHIKNGRRLSWKTPKVIARSVIIFPLTPIRAVWGIRAYVYKAILACIWGFCAGHVIESNVGFPRLSGGPSNLPTLANQGDWILEDIIGYKLNPTLSRGTLITFTSPLDPAKIVLKRVIGLPGDIVCVDPTGLKAPSTEHVIVPKGHVWVVGDNASLAIDSRDYGPLPIGLIRGRVRYRLYPNFTDFKQNGHLTENIPLKRLT